MDLHDARARLRSSERLCRLVRIYSGNGHRILGRRDDNAHKIFDE